jgi:hypothetical protein
VKPLEEREKNAKAAAKRAESAAGEANQKAFEAQRKQQQAEESEIKANEEVAKAKKELTDRPKVEVVKIKEVEVPTPNPLNVFLIMLSALLGIFGILRNERTITDIANTGKGFKNVWEVICNMFVGYFGKGWATLIGSVICLGLVLFIIKIFSMFTEEIEERLPSGFWVWLVGSFGIIILLSDVVTDLLAITPLAFLSSWNVFGGWFLLWVLIFSGCMIFNKPD